MSEVTTLVDPQILGDGSLRLDVTGGVLTLTLDRPEARNAQTPATWRALAAVGAAVKAHPEGIDAIVVTGVGPSFSAGLDRRMFTPEGIPGEASLMTMAALDDAGIDDMILRIQEGFTWLGEVEPLSIAAVSGHAIGAGFQLALACDMILAAPDASFAMRETSYGLVPDLAGTWPLVRAVGYGRALDICATGREVSAEEGYRLGFVTRVEPDLEQAVSGFVTAVRAAPPGAVRDLTALLRGAQERTAGQQHAAERSAQAGRLRSLRALLGG
ncbi:MAG: enoyl-CoA hydratase/isomerase family protein [Actinomycetota bacterium]